MSLDIQNYDLGSVAAGNNEFQSGVIKFPGADSYLEGTIMAVKEVADAITVAADAGNTGDGTVAAAVAAGNTVPKVGAYNLECTFVVTNGGVFKLEDPNGNIIADNITLRVGDGLVTSVVIDGIAIDITEGSTDFAAGDKFSLTVAADGDYVVYAVDGKGGAQIPQYVLREDYTATEAADVPGRVMISGKIKTNRLIIDGSAAGVGITDAIINKLRDFGFIPVITSDLSILDNQ